MRLSVVTLLPRGEDVALERGYTRVAITGVGMKPALC